MVLFTRLFLSINVFHFDGRYHCELDLCYTKKIKRPAESKTNKLKKMFELPANFIASSTAYIGQYITALSEPLALLFGTALAFWVIPFVLGLIKRRGRA